MHSGFYIKTNFKNNSKENKHVSAFIVEDKTEYFSNFADFLQESLKITAKTEIVTGQKEVKKQL